MMGSAGECSIVGKYFCVDELATVRSRLLKGEVVMLHRKKKNRK